MTDLPPAGYLSNASRDVGEMKQALEDIVAVIREIIGGNAEELRTISNGVITPTRASVVVDTESGAAADDLDQISTANLPDGRTILIRSADASRVVTVRHAQGGAGQIHLVDNANLALSSPTQWLWLIRRGNDWHEIMRGFGNNKLAALAFLGFPALTGAGKSFLRAREDETGVEFRTPAQVITDIAAIKQGKHTISLTAGAAAPWNSQDSPALDYYSNTYVKFWAWTLDSSMNMGAMFSVPMPKGWNEASALEIEILWAPAASEAGDVKWDAYVSHQGDGDGDPTAWAVGPLSVTDASNGVQYALHVAPVINTGAIPNVSENDTINILIVRNAADEADTMVANALLRGIRVKYAVNAPSDD